LGVRSLDIYMLLQRWHTMYHNMSQKITHMIISLPYVPIITRCMTGIWLLIGRQQWSSWGTWAL